MSRNNVERLNDKNPDPLAIDQQNRKIKVQKGILAIAMIVILMALLVFPKYQAYAISKSILEEKRNHLMELPDQMTEQSYLKQLGEISQELNETRNSLPESIDTVRLYEVVAKLADTAEVRLISLQFGLAKHEIDDQLGMRISREFKENDQNTVTGPDGKFLASCEFTVVCSGTDEAFMAFLDRLNQSLPLIRVISYEVGSGSGEEKQLRLRLESYGIVQNNQGNQIKEETDQPEERLTP